MSETYDNSDTTISIRTDSKDVIGSGVVLASGDSVDFKVGDLALRLEFRDKKNQEESIEQRVEDKTLYLTLINFNNPLGAGLKEPLNVGTLDGREYFIAFEVSKAKDAKVRKVIYTFYLGDEVSAEVVND